MKNFIYVVMGGMNYEGENYETVSLFTNEETALSYGKWLVEHEYYDRYVIVKRVVETE